MAQAGYTPIQLYLSTTASAVPSAGNLANGELAINITDGKLFYKDNGGVVRVLAGTGGAGVVAGSNTQLQFNNNGVFGASSGLTWDGTNLTASQVRSSGLTSGRVTYAGASGQLVDSANMTFNGTRLTVADLADSGLTSGRVVYSTSGGALVDSANLLYSGTDLTVYGITVGRGAGAVSTNTAVGASALAANTSGFNNSVFGLSALKVNTTGNSNTAVGINALASNTTGYANIAVGRNSLLGNTTGYQNIAIGSQDEISIYAPLRSNTTGVANNAIGNGSLQANTTGNRNVAIGTSALASNSTASNNAAFGFEVLYSNTTGAQNVGFGYQAGRSLTTGNWNTFIGVQAGTGVTTGSQNTLIGASGTSGAGYLITTGSSNTVLGGFSGNQSTVDIRTSSNCIVLSDGDGNPRYYTLGPNGDHIFDIRDAGGNSTLQLRRGNVSRWFLWNDGTTNNFNITPASFAYGVYLTPTSTSWTGYSDERLKDIIEPIKDAVQKLKAWRTVIGKFKTDAEGTRRVFFIAQDVQSNTPEVISKNAVKDDPTNTEYLGIQYTETIPVVAAAVNEHTDQIAAMAATIETLKAELAALKGA